MDADDTPSKPASTSAPTMVSPAAVAAANNATSSGASNVGGFNFLDIQTDLNPGQPLQGIVAPLDLRTASLFVHHDDELGLRQGSTNVRIGDYRRSEYNEQLTQFVEKPQEVFPGLAATFVLHSQKTLPLQDAEHKAAQFFPSSQDSPREEDIFLHHVSVEEANELLAEMSDGKDNMVPPGLDMNDATHVATLAMRRMSVQPEADVYARLVLWKAKKGESQYQQESGSDDGKDSTLSFEDRTKIFDDAKKEAEGMTGIKLYKETRALLQSLTHIRCSTVEGGKRVNIVIYCFSGCFLSIGLKKHLGTIVLRQQVRESVVRSSYLVQFINLGQKVNEGSVCTRMELVLCRSVAFHRQTMLEKGKTVGLADRAVCFSEEMGLCNDNIAPWQRADVMANEWIVVHHDKFIDNVVPEFLPKQSLLKAKGEIGVFGHFKRQVTYLVIFMLMKMQPQARKQYLQEKVPYSLLPALLRMLNQHGNWEEDQLDYRPEPQTLMVACAYVTAHTAMLLSHSLQDNAKVLQPLIRHWQQECCVYARNGRLDVLESMTNFGVMLVEKFALPNLSLVVAMKKECGFTAKVTYRCQWMWYCAQAQLYRELSLMYNQQHRTSGLIHPDLDITAICVELAQAMADDKVFGRVVIGRRAKDGKPGTPSPSQKDKRYYPGANLVDFSTILSLKDEDATGKDALGNNCKLDPTPQPLTVVIQHCDAYGRLQLKAGDPPEKQGEITWPIVLGYVHPVETPAKQVFEINNKIDEPGKSSAGSGKEPPADVPAAPGGEKKRKASGLNHDDDSDNDSDFDPKNPNDLGQGDGESSSTKNPKKPRKNKTTDDFVLSEEDRKSVQLVVDTVTTPEPKPKLIQALSWCFRRTKQEAMIDALKKIASGPPEEDEEQEPDGEEQSSDSDDWDLEKDMELNEDLYADEEELSEGESDNEGGREAAIADKDKGKEDGDQDGSGKVDKDDKEQKE